MATEWAGDLCVKGDIVSPSPYPHTLTTAESVDQEPAAVAASSFQSTLDKQDWYRAVMEDTRARWDRAYVEALDFDTWGQVGNAGEAPRYAAMDATSMHAPMECLHGQQPCSCVRAHLCADAHAPHQVEEATEGYQRLQVAAAAVRGRYCQSLSCP